MHLNTSTRTDKISIEDLLAVEFHNARWVAGLKKTSVAVINKFTTHPLCSIFDK